MVRCIPYALSDKPDCTRNFVLIPAETVRYLPIQKIVNDFVFLDKTIGYNSEAGVKLRYRWIIEVIITEGNK